jgi:hypothetical protein
MMDTVSCEGNFFTGAGDLALILSMENLPSFLLGTRR